jgi:CHASE3 domain sensor protein
MNRSLQGNSKILQILFVVVPIVIGLVFFFVSRQINADQRRALLWVRHTHEVRYALSELSFDIQRAESAQRGYLLTGQPPHLIPYLLAKTRWCVNFHWLKALVRDNQVQSERIGRLGQLCAAKFAEMDKTVAAKQAAQNSVASTIAPSEQDLALSSTIAALVSQVDQTENALLAERRKINVQKLELKEWVSTILLALSAGVVIVSGLLLLRIRKLQSLITICAWTQRVNYNGKWMRMEDFLWERFRLRVSHGISEEAFEGVMGIVGKNLTVSDSGRASGSERAT